MDDSLIVARCLAGEPEAFEAIVNRYQTGILSLAWSLLGNRAEAEDAVQEAFIRAYSNLSSFDPSKSFKTWLYAIAHKKCLDGLKKRKAEKKYRSEIWSFADHDPRGSSGERRTEVSAFLAPLIGRLNARERLALSLSVNEGFRAAEIAEVLHCAENTARVHIFNARKKLRKWMKGMPHV
jgi:RNA polymerase sigma-70 factor (ECF subfamily)